MKIVFFVADFSGGGAERVVSLLGNELVGRGYEIFIITDTHIPFAYPFRKDILFFDVPFSSGRKYDWLKALKRSRVIVQDIRPDIVITIMPLMFLMAKIAMRGIPIPVIASDHTSFERKLPFHIRLIRKFFYKWADMLTVLTKADSVYIGSHIKNKVVMPNPVSYPVFTGECRREKCILAVGRLDVWMVKGFDLLIRAWGSIAKQYPDWNLKIAGTGRPESFHLLRRLALECGCIGQIEFLGFRSDIDLLMRQSAIFVLSSREEGFGLVLAEAMSQGCACISFDHGGRQREIITPDFSGILLETHSCQLLAEAMSKLIADDSCRQKLSINARKDVVKFSLNKVVDLWEDLIRKVVLKKFVCLDRDVDKNK